MLHCASWPARGTCQDSAGNVTDTRTDRQLDRQSGRQIGKGKEEARDAEEDVEQEVVQGQENRTSCSNCPN